MVASSPAPRRWRRRFVIAGFALLAMLVLAELVLRLVERRLRTGYPVGLYVSDARCVFRLPADFRGSDSNGVPLRTNGLGFRGGDVGPKQAGTPRLLVLGDSFTFGHSVREEDGFTFVLAQRRAAAGRPVEVLNAGVPGYGTVNERGLLEARFDEVRPDAVLLALYVGNDFYDNASADFGRLVARGGVLTREPPGAHGLGDWLRLEVVSRSRLAMALVVSLGGAPAASVTDPCALIGWDANFGYAMLRTEWEPSAQRAFDATCTALQQVADFCRPRDVRLSLALLPGPCQYSDSYWQKVVRRCSLDASEFRRDKPNVALAEWAGRQGVPLLDLLPVFRERTQAQPDVPLFTDVHFSPAGHALAAEALDAFLPD